MNEWYDTVQARVSFFHKCDSRVNYLFWSYIQLWLSCFYNPILPMVLLSPAFY